MKIESLLKDDLFNKIKDIAKKEKPSYITRTDSNGNYHFQNIAKGTYQILALDDKNQNLI